MNERFCPSWIQFRVIVILRNRVVVILRKKDYASHGQAARMFYCGGHFGPTELPLSVLAPLGTRRQPLSHRVNALATRAYTFRPSTLKLAK